jgi:hypothetical protein
LEKAIKNWMEDALALVRNWMRRLKKWSWGYKRPLIHILEACMRK